MEAEQLRGLSTNEVVQKKRELIDEIFHLKLKRGTSQLENPMKLRQAKRDLARVETVLREQRKKREGKMNPRGRRKVREGVVTSNRMQKTVVVSVQRTVMDPKYKRYMKRRTRVKAHDEKSACQPGDRVLIIENRPLSRDKRWRVCKILERAVRAEPIPDLEAGAQP